LGHFSTTPREQLVLPLAALVAVEAPVSVVLVLVEVLFAALVAVEVSVSVV
jgi:hypothetical protein